MAYLAVLLGLNVGFFVGARKLTSLLDSVAKNVSNVPPAQGGSRNSQRTKDQAADRQRNSNREQVDRARGADTL